MQRLFRQGAFQGASSRDAYLVKCDSETTTQHDINRGIVNIVVGLRRCSPPSSSSSRSTSSANAG